MFRTSYEYDYSADITGLKYEGSLLDNYLENEWYTSLSQDMKGAIAAQDITQNMFYKNRTPAVLSSWGKDGFTETDISDGSNYTLSKNNSFSVGSKHVYALDVQDVIDYLGNEFNPQDLNEMFFNQRSSIEDTIWLRSADAYSSEYAFFVNGWSGSVDSDLCFYGVSVRPAFVIDLSKTEFTK